MDGQTFNRFEKKYLVTRDEKEELLQCLLLHMNYDIYSEDGYYPIFNIYYDTPDQNLIRQSVDKPFYKVKFRLRSYHCPVSPQGLVFLELKKKIDGKVTKRRLITSYQEALDYLEKGIEPKVNDFVSNQVLSEMNYLLKHNPVKPNYYIGYERRALADDQNQLRVTIDKRIDIRTENINLEHCGGISLLPENHYLIEIKSASNFPLWLAQKLSEMKIYAQSFSKYGEAYRMHILGDEKDV